MKKPEILLILVVIGISLILLFKEKQIAGDEFLCPNCNVILIVVDTLRADHLGCYGYSRNITPNIDRLSEEGIVFKNAFAQSSWTRPSMASILTGLYTKNHGTNRRWSSLSDDAVLFSEILQAKGYETYAFTANPNVGSTTGFNQGYTLFYDTSDGAVSDSGYFNEKIYSGIDSINSSARNFIYVHYIDPHVPYTPSVKAYSAPDNISFSRSFFTNQTFYPLSKPDQKNVLGQMVNAYDDEILFNDRQIGLLLKRLTKNGIYQKSIVVVVSDHGEGFYEHNSLLHGSNLFDESTHVPLIMHSLGWKNKTYDEVVSQVDIMPTLLHILGFDVPEVDGEVILPPRQGRFVYSELGLDGPNISCIRGNSTKLIAQMINPKIEASQDNISYRWFSHYAEVSINESHIELQLMSYRITRTIRITADGAMLMDVEVPSDKKYTLNISLPGPDVHSLILTSLSPCDSSDAYEPTWGTRYRNFMIFNGSVDLNGFEEMGYMYFDTQSDALEQNNLYYFQPDKAADEVKELERYHVDVRGFEWGHKTVTYTEELKAQLTALGYMN